MLKDFPPDTSTKDANTPPLYHETIILYADAVGTWLWLENYEDALLSDGSPDKKIHLKVGIGGGPGKKQIFNAGPASFGRQTTAREAQSISRYLDVLEIIKFQQKVLVFAQKPTTIISSSKFISACLLEGLKDFITSIEITNEKNPFNIFSQYLLKYPATKTRDEWRRSKYTVEQIDEAKNANIQLKFWGYFGKESSHLQPGEFGKYEKEGFVGYFPRPDYILQEEQTQLFDDLSDSSTKKGVTIPSDFRDIKPISPIAFINVPIKINAIDPYEQILKATDEFLKAEYAKMAQKSGSEVPKMPVIGSQRFKPEDTQSPEVKKTKPLHEQMDRICCFAFRGDSRDPNQVLKSGFIPNLGRKPEDYKPLIVDRKQQIQAMLDTIENDMNPKSWIQAMIEARVFNIGDFVANEAYGAFISTTKSLAIAKSFSSFYQNQFQEDIKLDIYNTQSFCYVVQLKNALNLAPQSELQRRLNKFHNVKEQEISNLGPIYPENIYGFRLCCALPIGQRLTGPVWLRKNLIPETSDFSNLYAVLSGKSQGKAEYIYQSYKSAFTTRKPELPAKKDI